MGLSPLTGLLIFPMPRPTTALIVDDEVHVRVYLRMVLKQLGVSTIWEAGSVEEAKSLFGATRPQVVLLDVVLPGVQGSSLFEELLAMDPNANVIIVTSQNALKTVQDMHALGAIAYVLKHTPRDQLLKALAEALDWVGAQV